MSPKVSLGLPIYNGENFVREAIDSILTQTFTDFELVITDNGSTDKTQEICEAYAAQDARVKYFRNERNLGAAPNFNRAFEKCRGEYFKWVAHDDVMGPRFLEACVDVLDNNPDVVLCFPNVVVIDETGKHIDKYDINLTSNVSSPTERFRSLTTDWHMCFDIFGLIRRDALAQTPLMGSYGHGDGVLLARLGLMGRFHKIQEVMFYSRRHMKQSMRMFGYSVGEGGNDYHSYADWFDTNNQGKFVFPQWRILQEYGRSVLEVPISVKDKLLCFAYLAWWMVKMRRELWADLRVFWKVKVRKQVKRGKTAVSM